MVGHRRFDVSVGGQVCVVKVTRGAWLEGLRGINKPVRLRVSWFRRARWVVA